MILNKVEFILMNNPLKTLFHEKFEAKTLRSISSISNIDLALEIGCGNGNGTRIIDKLFKPKKIVAIDLDKRMIEIAKRKKKNKNTIYEIMDTTKLNFPDNHFDAIFVFNVIHHIPNWKDSLNEIKRVLKPNGELLLEELSIETFTGGFGYVLRKLLKHPYQQMYSVQEFTDYINEIGFQINISKYSNPLRMLKTIFLIAKKK
jgi:ubiquinone/menaquinone biosynthesis C-methylase UbiE